MIFLLEYTWIVFVPFVLIHISKLFAEPYVYAFYWIIAVLFIYHKATFKYKERIFNVIPIALRSCIQRKKQENNKGILKMKKVCLNEKNRIYPDKL